MGESSIESTLREGMRETWKGNGKAAVQLAVVAAIGATVAYGLGSDWWVVGVFFVGVIGATFLLMSAAAVFWVAVWYVVPDSVLDWGAAISKKHDRVVRGVCLALFVAMYIGTLACAIFWPTGYGIDIGVNETSTRLQTRTVFQLVALLTTLPTAYMVRGFVTDTD